MPWLAVPLVLGLEATAWTDTSVVVVDAAVGPAYLTNSRSHTLSHLFKPVLRLGVRQELFDRAEVGGAVVGLLDTSQHYRVLGALGQARYAPLSSARFSLGAAAGLGLGVDADILNEDLAAHRNVTPYWLVGVDGRWILARRWLLGIEATWQNAAVLQVGLLAGSRFGGSAR